jgi:hypothetical protein
MSIKQSKQNNDIASSSYNIVCQESTVHLEVILCQDFQYETIKPVQILSKISYVAFLP